MLVFPSFLMKEHHRNYSIQTRNTAKVPPTLIAHLPEPYSVVGRAGDKGQGVDVAGATFIRGSWRWL